MKVQVKKWLRFIVRWGIAVGGIWWVLANMALRDQVLMLDAQNRPVQVLLAEPATENSPAFKVVDPNTHQDKLVPRQQVVNAPDQKTVMLQTPQGPEKRALLGVDLEGDINHKPTVRQLLIADASGHAGEWIAPDRVVGGYQLKVPHPRVETGVISMIRTARMWLIVLALAVYPIGYILTSYRWHALLSALEIRITLARAFTLNLVGAFYNTFMPGVTGGDVLKAYYAAKHTTHRTRAVLSVLVDRVIGLIALIIMGGTMATYEAISLPETDPVGSACRKIAIVSLLIVVGSAVGLFGLAHPLVRRLTGFDALLRRLPMQEQVQHSIEVVEIYRQRPVLVLWATIITLPVHLATSFSAMLAGQAFGLPISPGYYFVAVPVIILAASIPISPQGAGVMEFFAIKLTERQGATVGQAFALAMCIRLTGMVWNLACGLMVLRGGYHAPSEAQRKSLESDSPEAADLDTPTKQGS